MNENQTSFGIPFLALTLSGTIRFLENGRCLCWAFILWSYGTFGGLQAAEWPIAHLNSVFPAGGRQGMVVKVEVSGSNLDHAEELIFSHPGIRAVRGLAPPRPFDSAPQPVENQFDVTIGRDVPAGIYEVRVFGKYGVSTPRRFRVNTLPEMNCNQQNTSPAVAMKFERNSIINCSGTSADAAFFFQIDGKAGKPILICCETISLDSAMVAAMELWNEAGNPVASARASRFHEAFLNFTPSVDGIYFLKVEDALFRGGSSYFYRLEFSDRPRIESVWPPVGIPGQTASYQLFGEQIPEGLPTETGRAAGWSQKNVSISFPAQPALYRETSANFRKLLSSDGLAGFEYRFQTGKLTSNPLFLPATTGTFQTTTGTNQHSASAQPILSPAEIVGRIPSSSTGHWFSFPATKGDSYSIAIDSAKLNLPTDPTLAVFRLLPDAAGKKSLQLIQEVDDAPRTGQLPPFEFPRHDPAIHLQIPEEGSYLVNVRDLAAGTDPDPRNFYRLMVRPTHPDFQLLATIFELGASASQADVARAGSPTLRRGGTVPIRVQIERRDGWTGRVTLFVTGLPSGVHCPEMTVPADESAATLILAAEPEAPAWHGRIQVMGTAVIQDQKINRTAAAATLIRDKQNGAEPAAIRLMEDLFLSVLPEQVPLRIVCPQEQIPKTPSGGKVTISFHLKKNLPPVDRVTVEVRGLPNRFYPFNKAPMTTLEASAETGTIELTIHPQLPSGNYPCYLTAQTRVDYARNPEAVPQAESRLAALQKRITEWTPAVPNDVSEVLRQKLAAAEAEVSRLKEQVASLKKAAEPAKIDLFVASEPLLVPVTEAAPPVHP